MSFWFASSSIYSVKYFFFFNQQAPSTKQKLKKKVWGTTLKNFQPSQLLPQVMMI